MTDDRAELVRYATERQDCLDVLSDRERRILIARWSESAHQRKALRELGAEFGVSGSRIWEIECAAIRKIRLFRARDERRCERCGWPTGGREAD